MTLHFLLNSRTQQKHVLDKNKGRTVVKKVSKNKVIFSFNPQHDPAERVTPGELVLVETEDAFSGQIRSEKDSVNVLDWSRVDGATGPIFVEDARPGDTLVVEILEIKVPKKGVIVAVPKLWNSCRQNVHACVQNRLDKQESRDLRKRSR